MVVTTGMMRLVSDDELALVVGHDMAHIVMGHIEGGTGLYRVVRTSAPLTTRRAAIEIEADYVGAYLAAGAGYDVRGAADLWRRLASGQFDAAHPSSGERLAMARAVADEIVRKRAAHIALVPEGLAIAPAVFASVDPSKLP
jgi:predicted Zn-dependent protease